jgi:hypothetical protein
VDATNIPLYDPLGHANDFQLHMTHAFRLFHKNTEIPAAEHTGNSDITGKLPVKNDGKI